MPNVLRAGDWIFHAGENATTVSPGRDRVYAFDLEGRPLSWFEGGRVYKRSLGNEVFGRERKDGGRRYWKLSTARAASALAGVREAVSSDLPARLEARVRDRLAGILRWDPAALRAERERFDAVYEPIGILPPDQYLAVVLQATFGCSWNRCSFCSFYQGRSFRPHDPASFRSHARAVRDFLGLGARLRRRLFLSSGNALVMSNERLRPIFETASETFAGRPISGFVDVLTGERKSVEEWEELGALGLTRVHVGLETGDDALLDWLDKPGNAAASREFVGTLKRAGLSVAVIFMVGPGGRRFADDHVRNTLVLAADLPLDGEDIVYLSPFLESPDSAYARRAGGEGIDSLDPRQSDAQYVVLRDGIRRAHPRTRVSRYDIREFVY